MGLHQIQCVECACLWHNALEALGPLTIDSAFGWAGSSLQGEAFFSCDAQALEHTASVVAFGHVDLSFPTKDQTRAPCLEIAES